MMLQPAGSMSSMNEQQMWTQVRIIDEKYGETLCDRNTLSFSTLEI